MEACFNVCNRLVFGDRLMKLAWENRQVTEKNYSEKEKTPQYVIL